MGFSKPERGPAKPLPSIHERKTVATSPKWKKRPFRNPLREYRNPLPTIFEDPLLGIDEVPESLTHPLVPLQAADPLGRSWAGADMEDELSIPTELRGFRRKTIPSCCFS
ncbi:hypothetical protein N7466_010630 [Penicillium verhagenii]|uniref:uncharacterized protein n=1 Tax=Penicillium verhagenii TaxID=1562060 RepID=UPI0025456B2A|nr:uncharacterized protein N7466_010630 [Penicillium verhagenii]KAJ5918638.1 hypothetical protein N7466_010630 [Penicillium verhagenii]